MSDVGSMIALVHGGLPSWLNIVLIVAVVALVLFRRLRGEPLSARRVLLLPVILTVVGIVNLTKVYGVTSEDIAFVVVGGVVALTLGTARGASTELFENEGYLWQRYRRPTVVLWAVLIGVRVVLASVAHLAHAPLAAGTQTLLLGLGLSSIGEGAVVGSRALPTGVPFSPDPKRSGSGARESGLAEILDRLSVQSNVTSLSQADEIKPDASPRSPT